MHLCVTNCQLQLDQRSFIWNQTGLHHSCRCASASTGESVAFDQTQGRRQRCASEARGFRLHDLLLPLCVLFVIPRCAMAISRHACLALFCGLFLSAMTVEARKLNTSPQTIVEPEGAFNLTVTTQKPFLRSSNLSCRRYLRLPQCGTNSP